MRGRAASAVAGRTPRVRLRAHRQLRDRRGRRSASASTRSRSARRTTRQPRVVGAIYIDPSGGQVVRMNFSFTRAAFLDNALEDLSIVLENRLVGGRFWLPSRQEIEIERRGTWLDYPVRGIIRGRWEIGDYQFNTSISTQIFTGPEIVQAPPAELKALQMDGPRARLTSARRTRGLGARHRARAGRGARSSSARRRWRAPRPRRSRRATSRTSRASIGSKGLAFGAGLSQAVRRGGRLQRSGALRIG